MVTHLRVLTACFLQPLESLLCFLLHGRLQLCSRANLKQLQSRVAVLNTDCISITSVALVPLYKIRLSFSKTANGLVLHGVSEKTMGY